MINVVEIEDHGEHLPLDSLSVCHQERIIYIAECIILLERRSFLQDQLLMGDLYDYAFVRQGVSCHAYLWYQISVP